MTAGIGGVKADADDQFVKFSLELNAGLTTVSGIVEPNENLPIDLTRFLQAQERDYARALAEIRNGRKRSHWMWYIFPQLNGLGHSSTARFYAIKDIQEAKAFLSHPILGLRLRECAEAALSVEGRAAEEIFGFPDVLKLRSCATLFAQISEPGSVFEQLLEKHYGGVADNATLRLLNMRE